MVAGAGVCYYGGVAAAPSGSHVLHHDTLCVRVALYHLCVGTRTT